METNGELTAGKTEIKMVGWCVWWLKGAESEELQGDRNGQESLEWFVWESQNPQRIVMLVEKELTLIIH
jgi:hypothetical protein